MAHGVITVLARQRQCDLEAQHNNEYERTRNTTLLLEIIKISINIVDSSNQNIGISAMEKSLLKSKERATFGHYAIAPTPSMLGVFIQLFHTFVPPLSRQT